VENARLLDERLRKIISEVSSSTGKEIKKNLLKDLTEAFQTTIEAYSRRETTRLLEMLKSTIEKM
jgi:ribosomal protein S7